VRLRPPYAGVRRVFGLKQAHELPKFDEKRKQGKKERS
jgi:hypothetical protein